MDFLKKDTSCCVRSREPESGGKRGNQFRALHVSTPASLKHAREFEGLAQTRNLPETTPGVAPQWHYTTSYGGNKGKR